MNLEIVKKAYNEAHTVIVGEVIERLYQAACKGSKDTSISDHHEVFRGCQEEVINKAFAILEEKNINVDLNNGKYTFSWE